ncbi:transcription factor 25 isoform X1 [Cynara cardunculus var. scolymus]|uniref:transcription factor 25 isoform X1 n=1 Tax=Cynara cardunculus var. scolymus TaxID=59895 RepID=UPI000D6302F4|nr:transcription factor 25 isoform X1 [Cynara cardunculus var. scolymus]
MSARALRKVLKEQESAKNQNSILSADDESESPSDSPRPSSINPFALLNEQEQENDSSDADTSSIVKGEDNIPSSKKDTATKVTPSSQKSKKKKKKKKSKELSSSTGDMNSLDVILEDLSFGVNSSGGQGQSSKKKSENVNGGGDRPGRGCTTHILQVDPRFLSAENELRRIFGSKVVSSFERSNQPGSSRQNRPVRRGSHTHRKTILVSPLDHWPRWDGSLSMELLEHGDGCNYFRYVHSSTYILAQRQFEAAKATHDLNGIANILLHHPYHIDSLITLAEYFKFSGELQMSADATAKSLYALECAWHPLFNPLQHSCRLKYEHDTNKQIFTTLFAHMKNMDRRGCHRSALEICKLLISLDSDDPMGALFCIDYFSLRAEEYKWLERFSEEYNSDNSLWLYPNFSYSLAICWFYLEREEGLKETESKNENKATSSDLMKQALMLHPSVVRKLVAKVPLKEQVWTKIINHNFFGADQTGSASLDHLINIYVERSYIIWRLPELHNFLKDTALSVIEKMETNRSEARDWACVRKEAFASDKNEYSHLMVSDFSDSTPTIPPENLQNFMIDPRLAEMHNVAENQENIPDVARAPREVANRNALAVLFESMLPWIDYGTREGEGQDQENGMAQDHED